MMPEDHRFTIGLVYDVTNVLQAHGYRPPEGQDSNQAYAGALLALAELCRSYEGHTSQDGGAA